MTFIIYPLWLLLLFHAVKWFAILCAMLGLMHLDFLHPFGHRNYAILTDWLVYGPTLWLMFDLYCWGFFGWVGRTATMMVRSTRWIVSGRVR